VEWQEVSVCGEYNYDTKIAEEDIWVGPQVLFHSKLTCDKNPWVWGPWDSGCGEPTELGNETGVEVNGPHPVAAKYISGQLAMALRKAESAVLTEDMLNDWDPTEQTGGAPAVQIVTPTQLEFISPATTYYDVALQKLGGFPEPARILMQMEFLEEAPAVVGDIALPSSNSHWWQPLHSSDWPYEVFPFPLPISSGVVNGNKGFYRVRVRANAGWHGGNANIGGWTPWRTFCVGAEADCPDSLAQQAVSTQKLVSKALVKQIYNQGQSEGSQMLMGGFGGKVVEAKVPAGAFGSRAAKVKPAGEAKAGPAAAPAVKSLKGLNLPAEVEMTTKSGPGPSGLGGAPKPEIVKPGAMQMREQKEVQITKVSPGAIQALNQPKLGVKNTYYTPAPLTAGTTVTFGITFKNTGTSDSAAGAKYKLNCTVVKGSGDCILPSGEFEIGKVIPAGSERGISLISAKETKAGAEYRITVAVPPDQRGRPHTVTLAVPALQMERVPGSLRPLSP
jgi:hypothetical protein